MPKNAVCPMCQSTAQLYRASPIDPDNYFRKGKSYTIAAAYGADWLLRLLRNKVWARALLVRASIPANPAGANFNPTGSAAVCVADQLLSDSGEHVAFHVTSTSPQLLILRDVNIPGWSAHIDNVPKPYVWAWEYLA